MTEFNIQPLLVAPQTPYDFLIAQTRDTLIDTEVYSRFINSVLNRFYRSAFYRDYKGFLMNLGINRDVMMYNISSELADIDLHHNLPSLKHAAIMITEHILNLKGSVTTFEVIDALCYCHRNNMIAVTMLSKTQHQEHHSNPTSFISLKQCWGDPFAFINEFIDGMTLDISFNFLMHFKLEEQHGDSFNPKIIKARNEILTWQQYQ